ncbi:hypothetical protein ACVJMY_005081 [Bradyrhizobium diazoefficiens]
MIWSVNAALTRMPGTAIGGAGPPAGRLLAFDRRPAEGAVDEEVVGLAVEELHIRGLLAGPDVQPVAKEALLEIGVVEPLIRQRLDLADGGEVLHVVAREPAAVDHEGVGVEAAAAPADELVQIGIDREIEAAEMDRAARNTAGHIADVVGDVGGAEIQALVGEPVMPFVEPFWRQPFRRAFVLGAGARARARQGARQRNCSHASQQRAIGNRVHGWVRYLKMPVRRMNK